jgi:hypothetical protein
MSKTKNGWREGYDPALRLLRIIAALTGLAVFAILALEREDPDLGTLALAVGAVLVLLGYESVVRLPWLSIERRERPDPPKEDAE